MQTEQQGGYDGGNMPQTSTSSASNAAVVFEIREIAETAAALAVLDVARLDPERIPHGVMPSSAAVDSARLDHVERGRLAAASRGVMRKGNARSAAWWRRVINQVRRLPSRVAGKQNEDAANNDAQIVAIATTALFVELSVRAMTVRRAPDRPPPVPIDPEVDQALAGLTRLERIVLAQMLGRECVALPTDRGRTWWLSRIEEARHTATGPGGVGDTERLANALSVRCME